MSDSEPTGLNSPSRETTRDSDRSKAGRNRPEPTSSKAAGKAKASDNETEDEGDASEEAGNGDESEDDEDDEEPKLKYQRRTKDLGSVYRNGDAVSASLVAGDKMVLGSHNGFIHLLQLPSLQQLRTYHPHTASVTSISISPPPPPPLPLPGTNVGGVQAAWKHIFVASSSIDGHVFISPITQQPPNANPKAPQVQRDLLLKSFGRPVLSVALSPNFYNDRTFLSGGLAGSLVLSQNDRPGSRLVSNLANTSSNPVSWLGSTIGGLTSGPAGKDVVLHGGEGQVSTITWSQETSRFVAWGTEQGIKIMRSHMFLPEEAETLRAAGVAAGERVGAWKRISAIDRPQAIPEDLAAVNKPRMEWVDRRVMSDDEDHAGKESFAWETQKERLVIGWGPCIWIVNVTGVTKAGMEGDQKFGYAEIIHILQTDGTISGISLYTPSTLLLLVHVVQDDDEDPEGTHTPSRTGRHGRHNALLPELRIISLADSEEVATDQLQLSRFEGLSAGDYHLGMLPATPAPPQTGTNSGSQSGTPKAGLSRVNTLVSPEFFTNAPGQLWAASINATTLLSSAMSVRSVSSAPTRVPGSRPGSGFTVDARSRLTGVEEDGGWGEVVGRKIFITSPYDLVFVTERGNKDHLEWMLSKEDYSAAWDLVDKHPEVMTSAFTIAEDRRLSAQSEEETDRDDASTIADYAQGQQALYAAARTEKRRIGELWIQKLLSQEKWAEAGEVCGKVLETSARWEHWVWIFEAAGKVREISHHIPTVQLRPPIPSLIYESILAHYLANDRQQFRELFLDKWGIDNSLFDVTAIVHAVENRLYQEFPREEEKRKMDPQVQADWQMLEECVAKGYLAANDYRSALRHFIILQDADEAFGLIKRLHLLDAVAEDIPGFVLLRVNSSDLKTMTTSQLEEATSEAITLLVDDASHGMVKPSLIVTQLQSMPQTPSSRALLFFYLRGLWRSDLGTIWEPYADLLLDLLAEFSRPDLFVFLRSNFTIYSLDHATRVCEENELIPELVFLLSQTGAVKRALFLIIDKLEDVPQAIGFAKARNDPDLWNDLLDYSMDKPAFIRGLLENVGTAIDPLTLVRRIPEGLVVEGLKDALRRIVGEYAVQYSISEGVANVCRSEVGRGMQTLAKGRRRGVKVEVVDFGTRPGSPMGGREVRRGGVGRNEGVCVGCGEKFLPNEKHALLAFACTHTYHLRCLLSPPPKLPLHPPMGEVTLPKDDSELEDLILGLLPPPPGPERARGHLVGVKAARAKLLKSNYLGRGRDEWGCGVCREERRRGAW